MEKPTYRLYLYKSPFGAMTIRPDIERPDVWGLVHETFSRSSNGEVIVQPVLLDLGWSSAEKAAEAVRSQQTGWRLWDSLPFVVHPATLEDWIEIETDGTTQSHR
ncbi:hypothetical protein [Paraburkholderia sp. Ac-20347]|uniref:hypothetical protein n=1 Tax=Paraburkholderia sp. Ac-20347 TaxID=2703892 RepID=UPI0019818934|nr:hypothetical protein [Paraburkholderia sp. Ac-20347]MBN3811682.1 hypothetical protein [Paraburkholderia sp. Ac-20347]